MFVSKLGNFGFFGTSVFWANSQATSLLPVVLIQTFFLALLWHNLAIWERVRGDGVGRRGREREMGTGRPPHGVVWWWGIGGVGREVVHGRV